MDVAIITSFINLGVGGVVAYLSLMWKRADDQAMTAERKATADAHAQELREEKARHAAEIKELLERSLSIQEKTLEAMTVSSSAMLSMKATADGLVSLVGIEKRLEKIEGAVAGKVNDGNTPKAAA